MLICNFCNKLLKRKYGLDLIGRRYCGRFKCRFKIWVKKRKFLLINYIINKLSDIRGSK